MRSGVVYLKFEQCTEVVNKKIYLRDVAEIYSADNNLAKKLGENVIYTVKGDKNEKIVFSVMKIIEMIQKEHQDYIIQNIGETDFIVEFKMIKSDNKTLEFVKLAFVLLTVFFGAAFTIMTFNTDVSVGDVFDNFYYVVMGTKKDSGSILEIAYSIGVPIGILGFYNHLNPAKIKGDPTPVHMEMRTYEEEKNKAVIEDASRQGKIIKSGQ